MRAGPHLADVNFASCQRKSSAYTVKGNAIKCFRSLDYELQIALSGFKWQLFSHRALMASIFKTLSFRAPTKNFRRPWQQEAVTITFSPVNIPINQRWNPVPSGIIKDSHLFFPYGRINWNNLLFRLWGQSDIITATKTTQTLSPRHTPSVGFRYHNWAYFTFKTFPVFSFLLTKQGRFIRTGLNERSEKSFRYRRNKTIILSKFGSECCILCEWRILPLVPPFRSVPSIKHLHGSWRRLTIKQMMIFWYP